MNAELLRLLEELSTVLIKKKQMLATAESCTGGLVASALTHLPGSSQWFDRGVVTYSNSAKVELLGVDEHLIVEHGAVSAEVAKAMVEGVLARSQATFAVSVTGVAGPTGGSIEKPVGTVWFGFGDSTGSMDTLHAYFGELSREEIRSLSVRQALQGLISRVV